MNFLVETAVDADNAIEMIRNADSKGTPFRIVLMDWRMPGKNGIDAVKSIKSTPLSAQPDIFIITAFGDSDIFRLAQNAGAKGILYKPINKSTLFDTLTDALHYSENTPQCCENTVSATTAVPEPNLNDLSVLLVEDNFINQQVAEELLTSVGAQVTIASNGQEAVDMIMASPETPAAAIILMDLQMPGMDGYEATARIRTLWNKQELPIIAMTAHAMTDDRDRCQAYGMNDHITKPIEVDKLYATLSLWAPKLTQPQANTAHQSRLHQHEAELPIVSNQADDENQSNEVALPDEVRQASDVDLASATGSANETSPPNSKGEVSARSQQQESQYQSTTGQTTKVNPVAPLTTPQGDSSEEAMMEAPGATSEAPSGVASGATSATPSDPPNSPIRRVTIANMPDTEGTVSTVNTVDRAGTPGMSNAAQANKVQPPYGHLDELDTRLALARLGNNEQLYNKLLMQFLEHHADVEQEFLTALKGNDPTEPVRIAHTLKGLAASIGAKRLTESASELEEVALNADMEQVYRIMPECFDSLNSVLGCLQRHFGALTSTAPSQPSAVRSHTASLGESVGGLPSKSPGEFSGEFSGELPGELSGESSGELSGDSFGSPIKTIPLLQKLYELLQDYDAQAVSIFEENQSTLLGSGLSVTLLTDMQRKLSVYDFDTALELVKELLAEANGDLDV